MREKGLPISNPNTGIVHFSEDSNGNLSADSITWNVKYEDGTTAQVVYDLSKKTDDAWSIKAELELKDDPLGLSKPKEQIQMHKAIDGKVSEDMQVRNDNGGTTRANLLSKNAVKEINEFIGKKKRVVSEDEKTGNEKVNEVSAVDGESIKDFIGTHAESEAQVDAYVMEFKELYKEKKIMTDISEKDFDKLMESIRHSLKNIKER